MLLKLKQFFITRLVLEEERDPQQQLQLAAAALLIELSRADYQRDQEEQRTIEQTLRKAFDLSEEQLQELVAMAEDENREATSLYQFTTLIKDHYSAEQRYQLIEMLWQVAQADGEISKYEDFLIRKIADLIYVPHSEFIRAKLAVLGED